MRPHETHAETTLRAIDELNGDLQFENDRNENRGSNIRYRITGFWRIGNIAHQAQLTNTQVGAALRKMNKAGVVTKRNLGACGSMKSPETVEYASTSSIMN